LFKRSGEKQLWLAQWSDFNLVDLHPQQQYR